MSARYFTLPEETRLDQLARAIYATERDGMVEALLDANPGLAAQGVFIVAGTRIAAPEIARPPARVVKTVDPWD